MAFTTQDVLLLGHLQRAGVGFGRVLTLGRLRVYLDQAQLQRWTASAANAEQIARRVTQPDGYSETLLRALGATQIDSMDYSAYEGASIIHDLNLPIPAELKGRFSCVIDSGTLEHVFNFPTAVANCMQMVEVGGHFIMITPANNNCGHGFYQFSPELFFRLMSADRGFKAVSVMLFCPGQEQPAWYEVVDPQVAHSRVLLTNEQSTFLVVVAQRLADAPLFARYPLQSDYEATWSRSMVDTEGRRVQRDPTWKRIYKRVMPMAARSMLRKTYDGLTSRRGEVDGLGNVDRRHYHRASIDISGSAYLSPTGNS